MNLKRQRFVEAYLTTAAGNATKAAEIAGYSARTARQIGSQLLTYIDVRQAVDARTLELKAKVNSDAYRLIAEVQSVAYKPVDTTERGKMKALELLGKYHKLWNEHSSTKDGDRITVNIGYLGVAPPNHTPAAPHTFLPDVIATALVRPRDDSDAG